MNIMDRGSAGKCMCCDGEFAVQATLTSEFLSKRAWRGDVEFSNTYKCRVCGFAFHGRGLSEPEVDRYYLNYRDEEYFLERNRSEFFYTRKVHEQLEDQLGGQARRVALEKYLGAHSVTQSQKDKQISILDFAGGKGRLIQDLSGKKYVFDVSGEEPVHGVTKVSLAQLSGMEFDLIVCAQMLEHATDPVAVLNQLFGHVKPGGHVYIEVPLDETWTDYAGNGRLRRLLLSLAKRHRWLNTLLDTYGTAFRVKLKILPPFAYVPVREHLNYFTPQSLNCLGSKMGGKVKDASRREMLGTVLLLQKNGQIGA